MKLTIHREISVTFIGLLIVVNSIFVVRASVIGTSTNELEPFTGNNIREFTHPNDLNVYDYPNSESDHKIGFRENEEHESEHKPKESKGFFAKLVEKVKFPEMFVHLPFVPFQVKVPLHQLFGIPHKKKHGEHKESEEKKEKNEKKESKSLIFSNYTGKPLRFTSGLDTILKLPERMQENRFRKVLKKFIGDVRLIHPGTLWCGDGNIAQHEDDLGLFYSVDECCKVHDKCPESIPAGHEFEGLKNNGVFTRSHCDCDKEFFNCLKTVRNSIADRIGQTYFNILKPQCFRFETQIIGCYKWQGERCVTYEYSIGDEELFQWFDNKEY